MKPIILAALLAGCVSATEFNELQAKVDVLDKITEHNVRVYNSQHAHHYDRLRIHEEVLEKLIKGYGL